MENPDHPRHPNDLGHQAIANAFLGEMSYRVVLPMVAADYPAP